MKTLSPQVLRTLTCLFAIILINCQQEDDSQKIDTSDESQKVTSKIVSAKDVPDIINFIRSKSNDKLEFTIKDDNSTGATMRDDEDN
ncbi:MAG: hypothetical protein IMY67_02980, partial [Bacteroidetes bacterium]|nr:hypothetical protein [Bacteroidota bacterium]